MARNAIAKVSWSEDEKALTFAFANDSMVVVNISDVPEGLHAALTMHGLEQKLRDSYAGSKTVEDALSAFTATLDTLKGGEWGKRREGSGPKQPAVLVDAIMLMYDSLGKPFASVDAAKTWLEKVKALGKLAAVKSSAQYIVAENTIRANRAATKPSVDLDALRDEPVPTVA